MVRITILVCVALALTGDGIASGQIIRNSQSLGQIASPLTEDRADITGVSYYTVQHPPGEYPPMPFNPLEDLGLPIYDLGQGRYLIDDQNVDYEWRKKETEALRLLTAAALGDDLWSVDSSFPEEGFSYSGTNVFISGISNLPANIRISVSNATPDAAYDIYFTPTLSPGFYWRWHYRGATNQTDFFVTRPISQTGFFLVAAVTDSDSDRLTDAYELLVTKTNPLIPDSNGDEIWDGAEDHDGDGLPNSDEFLTKANPWHVDSNAHGMSDGPNGGDLFSTDGVDNNGNGLVDETLESQIVSGPYLFAGELLQFGKIRGDNQIGFASQPLLLPFVVYLTGQDGTPVPNGTVVNFTATGPTGANLDALLSNTSDTTGNNGFVGQAQTFLTLSSDSGTHRVSANWGTNVVEFTAEPISSVTVSQLDSQLSPAKTGAVMGDLGILKLTAVGGNTNTAHVVGVALETSSNPSGIVVALYETAAGSATYIGAFRTDSLQYPAQSQGGLTANGAGVGVDDYAEPDASVEYASGDYAGESGSNFDDSDFFDLEMQQLAAGLVSRGSARSPLPEAPIPFTDSFLKAGGFELQTIRLGWTVIAQDYVKNAADFLYLSTHGLHDENVLYLPDNELFIAQDLQARWKRDIDMVIISGCSVLDVTGDKWPSSNTNRPGKVWANLGPKYFLGYEGSSPGDSSGIPSQIISDFVERWNEFDDFGPPMSTWLDVNGLRSAWNACALDCRNPKGSRVAWHWRSVFFTHVVEQVPESSW